MTNGRYDEATDTVVYPFFKNIPQVKWVQFSVSFFQFALLLSSTSILDHGQESSHVAQYEETGRVMEVVGQFFTQ